MLADRYGRARILQLTVLWFAAFTFLSGFTHSFAQLFFTRAMQGFGFGGEWAVGSVLVAEIIDARHRGKAAGLVQSSWSVGWAAAALAFWAVSSLASPQWAWKIVFWLGFAAGLADHLHSSPGFGAAHIPEDARATPRGARQRGAARRILGYFPRVLCCARRYWRLYCRPGCSAPTIR